MPHLTKIHGLVIPTNWDGEGKVLDIAIASFNEDRFSLERNEKYEELFRLIGQSVVVKGLVKEVDNKKIITVVGIMG